MLALAMLLGAQVLSVEDRGAVRAWRDLVEITAPLVEMAAAAPGADPTMMGQVALLANAHSWLAHRYGQIDDLGRLVALQERFRGRGLAVPHLGHGAGGDLEATVARLARPGDPLVVGKYEQWVLTLGNRALDRTWPTGGWSVTMHLWAGETAKPVLPGEDPAFAGTHVERNPYRFFLGSELLPDGEARVNLLLPPALETEIVAFEITLDGETIWIPWWENLL